MSDAERSPSPEARKRDVASWVSIGLVVAAGGAGSLMSYNQGLTQAAVSTQRIVALEKALDTLQEGEIAALGADARLSERVGILEASCRRK